VRAVGVSNYSDKRLRAVHKALAERGVPLATNQVIECVCVCVSESVSCVAVCVCV